MASGLAELRPPDSAEQRCGNDAGKDPLKTAKASQIRLLQPFLDGAHRDRYWNAALYPPSQP
jgi:hypothetical protein